MTTNLVRRLSLCFILCCVSPLLAVDRAAVVERVRHDIQYLSADEMEGRGPGTRGLQQAEEYIRGEFQRLGLKSGTPDGSFTQPFQINMSAKVVPEKTSLQFTGPDGESLGLRLGEDYQALAIGGSGHVSAGIVFAGYGISAKKLNYDDYGSVDARGKVIVILRREPQQDNPKSVFDGKKTTPYSYIQTKLKVAKQRGAAGVLFVNDRRTASGSKGDQLTAVAGFGSSGLGLPFAQVKRAAVDQLLAVSPVKTADGDELTSLEDIERQIDRTLQPVSARLDGWTARLDLTFEAVKADVANVIGVLEGEGPNATEAIVLGAHYDHIGFGEFGSRYRGERKVHNGADDNATGTAAIMELARRYANRAVPPSRRLVFIAFSAEERGLLGSDYYIKHPVYPLAETAAMFNFDMIGRLRNEELTLYGARSAREFPPLLEQANGEGLKLKLPPGVPRMGDHYSFYQAGIPAFHFFTGLTQQYHTPDDDLKTLNIEGAVKIVDYAERLLDAVLEMDDPPHYVKVEPPARPNRGVAYLGITPDYAATGGGVAISAVLNGSPAGKSGLKPGDVIIRMAEIDVVDLAALRAGLQKHKPGETVKVVVKREGREQACEVKLGTPPGQ